MAKQAEDTDEFVEDCRKLSASFLTKQGYFKGDFVGNMIWTIRGMPVDNVKIISNIIYADRPHIQLSYIQIDPQTEKKTNMDYKIYLEKVNSIIDTDKYFYYFICPLTSKKTSILYKPVSSNMYLHREAYKMFSENPLYSKGFSNLENRFGLELENKLSKLKEKLKEKLKSNHKKVPLKLIERVKELEDRVNKLYIS